MICMSCEKEIPEGSEFCPFCGTELSLQKRKKVISKIWIIPSTLLLCVLVALGYCYYYYETELAKANSEVRKANETIVSLGNEVSELKNERERLSESNDKLTYEQQRLQRIINEYANQEDLFDMTLDYLSGTKTSNGIISVNSKIYCVQRNDNITINVNWPSYMTTQYMGIDDPYVASAEWTSSSNIRVSGGQFQGVAELYIGSNQECTQNRMSVVIICY